MATGALGHLRVEISVLPKPQEGEYLDVDIKVDNTSKSLVTVLAWNSPLDPQAGSLGLFELRDTQDGSVQQGKVLMVNRLMPPSQDSLIEVPANASVGNIVRLKMLSLQSARSYEIVARGEWKAVWDKPRAAIDTQMLERIEGAITGEFVTNKLTVEIP